MNQILQEFVPQVFADGYAIVPGVIDSAAVQDLRNAIAALDSDTAARRRGEVYGIRNLLGLSPEISALARSESIREIVRPILGDGCFAVRALFFDKTPEANWKLYWHQDNVIAVKERIEFAGFTAWSEKSGIWQTQPPVAVLEQMVAVRVHLDDSGPDNGPLRVLPGSHRNGWLDEELDHWKSTVPAVTCVVDAGGVIMIRPLLLHASSRAEVPGHRRVIHIEFASQELPGGLQWHDRVA